MKRSSFKDLDGTKSTPHKKTPRTYVAYNLHHIVGFVKECRINWERHEKRMYGIASEYEHTFSGRQTLRAYQPPHAFKKRSGHPCPHTIYLNRVHALHYTIICYNLPPWIYADYVRMYAERTAGTESPASAELGRRHGCSVGDLTSERNRLSWATGEVDAYFSHAAQ